jgi:hypothetical protein
VDFLPYGNEHQDTKELGSPPLGVPPAIMKAQVITKPAEILIPPPPCKENGIPATGDNNADKPKPPIQEDKKANPEELPKTIAAQPNVTVQPIEMPKNTPACIKPILSETELQKKKEKKCDDTFSEYLNDVAKIVNKGYYTKVLRFVFYFRECLNQSGKSMIKPVQPPGINGTLQPENKVQDGVDFCQTNNAEQAPEISNEFVTVFLEEHKSGFERMDIIDLTQNFCNWLYVNGYTCSKLSLIQDNP